METKPVWQSKTVWMSLIAAAAPLVPPLGAWIVANPQTYSVIMGLVFAGLRLISNNKISIT